jgi:hypothetical protein
MAVEKVIGGPLNREVIAQLHERSKVYSKEVRTDRDIEYMNSRTGWVKLSSGVNVGTSDALARKYVLIGGTKGRQGTDTYSLFQEGLGYRPMPGITDVQITSVNRFGLLKEATVRYNCWDISQLEELERLFMRPGFTALLEWGHSIQLKSNGTYDTTPQTVTKFFDKEVDKQTIYSEIENLKRSSNQNYDAILGFVKNFSWSYRQDGGYDCTVSIISIGELIESMQIALDISSVFPDYTKPVDKTKKVESTFLQAILTCLREFKGAEAIEKEYPGFTTKYKEINGEDFPDSETFRLSTIITDNKQPVSNPNGFGFTYIPLRVFCGIVNMALLKDGKTSNIVHLNTKIKPLEAVDPTSKIPTCRFRTFKEHTSADPNVCIIGTMASTSFPYSQLAVDHMQSTRVGSSDEILNIYVNVDLLTQAVKNLVNNPDAQSRTLYNLFKPILNEISYAMGEINELDFHYDDTTSTLYIVDRKVQVTSSDLSEIPITGLRSTVSGFNFVTKLSPAVTTMVAISAQAGGADCGIEAEALLRWNEGLTSRVIMTRNVSGEKKQEGETAEEKKTRLETEQKERRSTIESALSNFYDKTPHLYDMEEFRTVKTEYKHYASIYVTEVESEDSKLAGPAGIIPFEVNIEMDGISGIKIGQAFTIKSKIMPSQYDGVVGFIVTGIDNKISNNRWTTNLKAQTIIISGAKNKSKPLTNNGISRKEKRGLPSVSYGNKLKTEYIPTRDKVLGSRPKGFRTLLTAHAQQEGFYPGTTAYDLKNPGNFTRQVGNIPTDGRGTGSFRSRFVKFKTLADGIKTQAAQVDLILKGGSKNYQKDPTLRQYIYTYAPPNENNSDAYIDYVIAFFKKENMVITEDMKLSEVVNMN